MKNQRCRFGRCRQAAAFLCMLLLLTALILQGCGGRDEEETDASPNLDFLTSDLSPYITLPENIHLQGVTVSGEKTMPESYYQKALAALLYNNGHSVEVTDRPTAINDKLAVYYEGVFVGEDGTEKPAEGATSKNIGKPTLMTLGEGRYIDGFEEGLLNRIPKDSFYIDPTRTTVAGDDIVCASYTCVYTLPDAENETTETLDKGLLNLSDNSLRAEFSEAIVGKTIGETYTFTICFDTDGDGTPETDVWYEVTLHGIVKMNAIELYLTFPDPYTRKPEYAGKPVKFYVWIAYISEIESAVLDETFVRDVMEFSPEEGETDIVAAFERSYREQLAEAYLEQQHEKILSAVHEAARDAAQFGELPADIVEKRFREIVEEADEAYEYYTSHGISFSSFEVFVKSYFSLKDVDKDFDVQAFFRSEAENDVRDELLFYQLCRMCGLSVTEEELAQRVAEELEEGAEQYTQSQNDGKIYTAEDMRQMIEERYGVGYIEETLGYDFLEEKLNAFLLEHTPVTYTGEAE